MNYFIVYRNGYQNRILSNYLYTMNGENAHKKHPIQLLCITLYIKIEIGWRFHQPMEQLMIVKEVKSDFDLSFFFLFVAVSKSLVDCHLFWFLFPMTQHLNSWGSVFFSLFCSLFIQMLCEDSFAFIYIFFFYRSDNLIHLPFCIYVRDLDLVKWLIGDVEHMWGHLE